jgi:hypothetical protein
VGARRRKKRTNHKQHPGANQAPNRMAPTAPIGAKLLEGNCCGVKERDSRDAFEVHRRTVFNQIFSLRATMFFYADFLLSSGK